MSANAIVVRQRQEEALRRAFGLEILAFLDDPKVIEIMLNPNGSLWVDYLGEAMQQHGTLDSVRARSIVDTVAAIMETVVNADNPILECEMPLDGSRFEAIIPPLVAAPTFALRKKALLVFSLDDYVQQGIMSEGQKAAIEQAVADRKNILVVGGTGTGKTTLANAVIASIANTHPDHRLVIIEDTRELQVASSNAVFLRTSDNTDMTRLLRATMRLRPDRIIVGEVRDHSALALLKAWNTGHPGGVGTIHSDDPSAALIRLSQLIQEAIPQPQHDLIAEAVNVVVSIRRNGGQRVIDKVARVQGFSALTGYQVESIA